MTIPVPADRIRLTGLSALGYHGVFPIERQEGQLFSVDLTLSLGPRGTAVAAVTDTLDDAVDYSAVAQQVIAIIEGEPVNLLEALAERIADAALGHGRVQDVEVTVHKPQAPLDVAFDDVAVTIVRSSETADSGVVAGQAITAAASAAQDEVYVPAPETAAGAVDETSSDAATDAAQQPAGEQPAEEQVEQVEAQQPAGEQPAEEQVEQVEAQQAAADQPAADQAADEQDRQPAGGSSLGGAPVAAGAVAGVVTAGALAWGASDGDQEQAEPAQAVHEEQDAPQEPAADAPALGAQPAQDGGTDVGSFGEQVPDSPVAQPGAQEPVAQDVADPAPEAQAVLTDQPDAQEAQPAGDDQMAWGAWGSQDQSGEQDLDSQWGAQQDWGAQQAWGGQTLGAAEEVSDHAAAPAEEVVRSEEVADHAAAPVEEALRSEAQDTPDQNMSWAELAAAVEAPATPVPEAQPLVSEQWGIAADSSQAASPAPAAEPASPQWGQQEPAGQTWAPAEPADRAEPSVPAETSVHDDGDALSPAPTDNVVSADFSAPAGDAGQARDRDELSQADSPEARAWDQGADFGSFGAAPAAEAPVDTRVPADQVPADAQTSATHSPETDPAADQAPGSGDLGWASAGQDDWSTPVSEQWAASPTASEATVQEQWAAGSAVSEGDIWAQTQAVPTGEHAAVGQEAAGEDAEGRGRHAAQEEASEGVAPATQAGQADDSIWAPQPAAQPVVAQDPAVGPTPVPQSAEPDQSAQIWGPPQQAVAQHPEAGEDHVAVPTGVSSAPEAPAVGPMHEAAPVAAQVDVLSQRPERPAAIVIALGGNVGGVVPALRTAVRTLRETEGVTVTDIAPLARTEAVVAQGADPQPDYLNTVVLATTSLAPREVLALLQHMEQAAGRVRTEPWGPRTLDADLIRYEDLVSDDPALTLPHPHAAQRAFVLVPWAQADPFAVLNEQPVAALAEAAPDAQGVRWLALDWVDSDHLPALPTGQYVDAPKAPEAAAGTDWSAQPAAAPQADQPQGGQARGGEPNQWDGFLTAEGAPAPEADDDWTTDAPSVWGTPSGQPGEWNGQPMSGAAPGGQQPGGDGSWSDPLDWNNIIGRQDGQG